MHGIPRIGAICVGTCLLAAAAPLPATENIECRTIVDDGARLSCYDSAAARAVDTVSEKPVSTQTNTATAEQPAALSAMARRVTKEEAKSNNPLVIIPHGRNYVLPVTFNSKINENSWGEVFPDAEMDEIETKFQISFKVRLLEDKIGGGNLWAAYTQQSWWQMYNTGESSAFRETNYEPELLMAWDNDWEFAGITNTRYSIGFNHQSNGRGNLLSRSWNRIFVGARFENENLNARLRLWQRIEESGADDDNPNMDKYYGYGDAQFIYRKGKHEFSALLRNNLRFGDGNKGALQLEWTRPVNNRLNWYLQYFYGYGESLIDYDVKTSRIGIGFSMNNLM